MFYKKKNKQVIALLGITLFFLVVSSGSFALETESLVYGEVKKNEDLRGIAEKIRPEHIAVEQMMLSLQKENPDAFYGDNVSFLKVGAMLRIDDISTLGNISNDLAAAEISRQHREWLVYRKKHRPNAPASIQSSKSSNEKKIEIQEWQRRLLVLEEQMSEIQGAFQSQEQIAPAPPGDLSSPLVNAAHSINVLEAKKRENKNLLQRLVILEKEIATIENLIQSAGKRNGENIPNNTLTSLAVNQQNTIIRALEEKSGSTFFSSKSYIAFIIFAVLMLAVLMWRSKKQHADKVDLAKGVNLKNEEPEQKNEAPVLEEVISFNAVIESKNITPSAEKMNSNHIESLEFSEVLLDPLAEADVYLTYEKYDKAETLIRGAIENDPCRQELKLKLLEVFALARNIGEFDKQADILYTSVDGQEENCLWQHALLMAQDIDTQNPLFSEGPASNEESLSEVNDPSQMVIDTDIPSTENLPKDTNDSEPKKTLNSNVVQKREEITGGEQVNEMVSEAIENAVINSVESIPTNNRISVASAFFTNEDINTKLDLAKAYIEMGDHIGALDLLADVLKEGTYEQKTEAKEIMELS